MPGEKSELAFGDVEGHVLERQGPLGVGLIDVAEADHEPESARSKSCWMSATSSSPRLTRMNPSGMPCAARSALVSAACDVTRGSDTRDSTPPKLGAWATSVRRDSTRSAARAPPLITRPNMTPKPVSVFLATAWSG